MTCGLVGIADTNEPALSSRKRCVRPPSQHTAVAAMDQHVVNIGRLEQLGSAVERITLADPAEIELESRSLEANARFSLIKFNVLAAHARKRFCQLVGFGQAARAPRESPNAR